MGEAWNKKHDERLLGGFQAARLGSAKPPTGRAEFSTSNMRSSDQLDAYRAWMHDIGEFWQPAEATDGYHASQVVWTLGDLTLVNERCDALETRLRAARARLSLPDHWIISVQKSGSTVVRSDDLVRAKKPGSLGIGTLTREARVSQTGGETLYLFVPRDSLRHRADLLDKLHNENLSGPSARLLASSLIAIEQVVDDLEPAPRGQVAHGALALLEACLLEVAAPSDLQIAGRKDALRREAVRFIRQNCSHALSPDMVARHLGQSRSALYRLFGNEEGVARLILTEKLAASRRALCDPEDPRRINQIANDFGFRSPSGFSRAFRGHFGVAPRDVYVDGVRRDAEEVVRRDL